MIANTQLTVARLKQTPLLAEALGKGGLKIIGGRYDLDSGALAVAGT